MAFNSPNICEPNFWLWVVEQEKFVAITKLYKGFVKFEYNIYHSTCHWKPWHDNNQWSKGGQANGINCSFVFHLQQASTWLNGHQVQPFEENIQCATSSTRRIVPRNIVLCTLAMSCEWSFTSTYCKGWQWTGRLPTTYLEATSSLCGHSKIISRYYKHLQMVICKYPLAMNIYERLFINICSFIYFAYLQTLS